MRSLGKALSQRDIYEAGQGQQIIVQSLWRRSKSCQDTEKRCFTKVYRKSGRRVEGWGCPALPQPPVLQDCLSSRGAAPPCSSSLGGKSYSRRLQQWMNIRDLICPSKVQQEAMSSWQHLGGTCSPSPPPAAQGGPAWDSG